MQLLAAEPVRLQAEVQPWWSPWKTCSTCTPSATTRVGDHNLRVDLRLISCPAVVEARTFLPSLWGGWLIGLEVVNREGIALGTVRELLATGPQTTLVLSYAQEDGKEQERMVPFVSAFVDQVDLPGRRIVVDWQPDY